MAKNVKETILSTLVNGPEILNEIEVLKSTEPNKIKHTNMANDIVYKLHKPLNLIVNEIIDTHKKAKIIRFNSVDGYLPPFEAGQYMNIFTEIEGVRTSRPYSISSSPSNRAYYEITVARGRDGFVSDYFLDKVKVGDVFEAVGPAGEFVYQKVFHSKKALYLAGGSGITPFLSMVRETLSTNTDRDMVMLYGCTNEDAALYLDEFRDFEKHYSNFKCIFVASDPSPEYKGETGFMTKELIKKLVPDFSERTSYICGPQIMNDFVVKELTDLNVPKKQIRREMFGAKKDITCEEGWPSALTGEEIFKVKVGDKTIEAKSSESLLTSLERNNILINACCRSGECGLCRVKLVSGKVFLSKGILARKADEKYGYIHSCKSYPISDIEIMI